MNKYEQRVKGKIKYLRRLKNYRLQGTNTHILKTTGKPCSCVMCSPAKTGEIKAVDQRRLDRSNLVLICDLEVRARQVKGYKYLIK